MGRSRSSFDDLANAIAAATSRKASGESVRDAHYRGVPLVSFDSPLDSTTTPPVPPTTPAAGSMPAAPDSIALDESIFSEGSSRRPPKLPDLSSIEDPALRCEKIFAWITEATDASDVFLADLSGRSLAASSEGTGEHIASAIEVANALARLAGAAGLYPALFEFHAGQGPFLQIIGFTVNADPYIIGFTRPAPLSPRQAHAIRLACRHALGNTLSQALEHVSSHVIKRARDAGEEAPPRPDPARHAAASLSAPSVPRFASVVIEETPIAPTVEAAADPDDDTPTAPPPRPVTPPTSGVYAASLPDDDLEGWTSPPPPAEATSAATSAATERTPAPPPVAAAQLELEPLELEPEPLTLEQTHRLIAHVEARAPEPHVARVRLALRAHLTLAALEDTKALAPAAIARIEAAAQDILGLTQAELRRQL